MQVVCKGRLRISHGRDKKKCMKNNGGFVSLRSGGAFYLCIVRKDKQKNYMRRILITGACGQIGQALISALRKRFGRDSLLACDISEERFGDEARYLFLDVCDGASLGTLMKEERITEVYHLAAILSARGEENPRDTWRVNMEGLWNVLAQSLRHGISRVFVPSSIAVFGRAVSEASQQVMADARTMYGITKLASEQLCQYYHARFGLDVRSLRYPGIVSPGVLLGGGTTDYTVDMFRACVEGREYRCFLSAERVLPMMYIDDAIHATLGLMEASAADLSIRMGYNISAMSFSPRTLAEEIQKHVSDFKVVYAPDSRDDIASSWPKSVDDSQARADWQWCPRDDISSLTRKMLHCFSKEKVS